MNFDKSIKRLTKLLRAVEEAPDDYPRLLTLQRAIAARIIGAERKIAIQQAAKADLARKRKQRVSKQDSIELKALIDAMTEVIDKLRYFIYIVKSFGDGLAYAYLDTFALKHMYFETHTYNPKQTAGALGKDGFRNEWRVLKMVIEKGVPAVLCDLTNTLRHGDICPLVGPDPIPVEIKSSANRSARADRQIANVQALNSFYATDEAETLHGIKDVKRMEVGGRSDHIPTINECIKNSGATNFAYVKLEGLTYFAVRGDGEAARLDQLGAGPRTILATLNETKQERQWMPYYPFTLSIRDEQDLLDFINGEVVLGMMIHADEVVAAFAKYGLDAQFINNSVGILKITRTGDPEGNMAIVPLQFFQRVILEFMSIDALIQAQLAKVASMDEGQPELTKQINEKVAEAGGKVTEEILKQLFPNGYLDHWPPRYEAMFPDQPVDS
jgi:hypothetical protein